MRKGLRLTLLGLVSVLVLALSPAAFGDQAAASKSLTVHRTGAGVGTVTSQPSGISCGSKCSHAFHTGASVALTAKPSVGSRFAGWSGACSGLEACSVTMNQSRTVNASFRRASATLRVIKAGSGLGKVFSPTHAISCGSICSRVFGYGASVILRAKPLPGSKFTGWSGACSGTGLCKITLTATTTAVTATFTKNS